MIDLLTCENPENCVKSKKLSETNKPDSFLVSAQE